MTPVQLNYDFFFALRTLEKLTTKKHHTLCKISQRDRARIHTSSWSTKGKIIEVQSEKNGKQTPLKREENEKKSWKNNNTEI